MVYSGPFDVLISLRGACPPDCREHGAQGSPIDVLELATHVYEGLSPRDIDEIEEMARLSTFFADAHH